MGERERKREISYMFLALKIEDSWLREESHMSSVGLGGSPVYLPICCLPASIFCHMGD